MNNQRRKEIDSAIKSVETLDKLAEGVRIALAAFEEAAQDIKDQIRDIANDEQEAFDNLPESLQAGENGVDMEAAISSLEEAIDGLEVQDFDWEGWTSEDVVRSLDEAKGM